MFYFRHDDLRHRTCQGHGNWNGYQAPVSIPCKFGVSGCRYLKGPRSRTLDTKQASTKKGMSNREKARPGEIPSQSQQEANSDHAAGKLCADLKVSFRARKPGNLQNSIGFFSRPLVSIYVSGFEIWQKACKPIPVIITRNKNVHKRFKRSHSNDKIHCYGSGQDAQRVSEKLVALRKNNECKETLYESNCHYDKGYVSWQKAFKLFPMSISFVNATLVFTRSRGVGWMEGGGRAPTYHLNVSCPEFGRHISNQSLLKASCPEIGRCRLLLHFLPLLSHGPWRTVRLFRGSVMFGPSRIRDRLLRGSGDEGATFCCASRDKKVTPVSSQETGGYQCFFARGRCQAMAKSIFLRNQ